MRQAAYCTRGGGSPPAGRPEPRGGTRDPVPGQGQDRGRAATGLAAPLPPPALPGSGHAGLPLPGAKGSQAEGQRGLRGIGTPPARLAPLRNKPSKPDSVLGLRESSADVSDSGSLVISVIAGVTGKYGKN